MSTQFHSLKVSNLQRETEGCVSVAFEVPTALQGAFSYASGQYLTLKTVIDGEELRRSYSLCSAPHENEWRVAIKEIPNGKFSSFANQELQVGDEVIVETKEFWFVYTLKHDKIVRPSAVWVTGVNRLPELGLAADEPFNFRFFKIPFQNTVPFLFPLKMFSD